MNEKIAIAHFGENPDRVFNVGTLSAENSLKTKLLDEIEIRNEIGIKDMQLLISILKR